ncbi:MAG: Penicillin-binding protein 1A [Porticoccaceae bacterium UBA1117]|nr:MAG: Penicillin-binding protein 1A [Porticoccaceae bacterium UBA1117]
MKKNQALRACLIFLTTSVGGFLLITSCLFLYLSPKLPSIDELKDTRLQIPLKVISQDLKLISEFGEKKRTPVEFSDLPQNLVDALLAAEDDSFFEHKGIVISGLVRSVVQLALEGRAMGGGSTITMQVARNFFFHKRKEFTRKFNEILLAFRIEEALTKEEIFSLYANKMFLGKTAYGFAAAGQVYYGKSLKELSLAQLAMIAGLPKAPSRYNPIANSERATERRDWILGRMMKLGTITNLEYQTALMETDVATYHGSKSELDADYVAEIVRQEVIAKFGLQAYTEGYTAITTIDSSMQTTGLNALQTGILAYDQRHGYRGAEASVLDAELWKTTLRSTRNVGPLAPAIVIAVADDRLTVLAKDSKIYMLNWADGLKNLRLYKTVDSKTAPISSAEDAFNVGDLIRVKRGGDGQMKLAQLPKIQSALVALDPYSGAVRTLVGGFDYRQSRFNRVTQAFRQPGSNFKPFIYATALNNGFTTASLINDAPVVFDDVKLEETWRPENDGGKFYGPTRLREGLYRSQNLVSVRLLRRMGIDKTLESLQSFGFDTSEMQPDLSLALGSHALTPLQIATGYAIFANNGFRVDPYILAKVIDRDGNIIYQAAPEVACDPCEPVMSSIASDDTSISEDNIEQQLEKMFGDLSQVSVDQGDNYSWDKVKQSLETLPLPIVKPATRVIGPQTAFLIDSMLKDVILRGTGVKAKKLNRKDLGGKTGTTNGPRDAWFSGYSPHLVATAWVGFDDNSMIGRNEYGGSAALPIWINFMQSALAGKPQIIRPQPNEIVMVKIDPKTGTRVAPNQPGVFEYFKAGTVPPAPYSSLNGIEIDQNSMPDDVF